MCVYIYIIITNGIGNGEFGGDTNTRPRPDPRFFYRSSPVPHSEPEKLPKSLPQTERGTGIGQGGEDAHPTVT